MSALLTGSAYLEVNMTSPVRVLGPVVEALVRAMLDRGLRGLFVMTPLCHGRGLASKARQAAAISNCTTTAGFDFEIKVTARIPSRTSASVSRRNPPAMWNMASGKFSQISVAEPGRLAFLSGQIAAAPGSQDTPKDIAGQADLATASLSAALEDLEASAKDIVMMRVYVVNATTEAFQQVLTALRELLGDAMPSMTTIGVQALYTPEILVEIEMVVRLP